MLFEGQSGPRVVADGANEPVRLSRDCALITQDGHARYQEAIMRGNAFIIQTAAAGVTLAAANASLVAATAQPIVGFLNPQNSGIRCVIWEAILGAQATGAAAVNEGIGVYQYAPNTALTSISGTSPLNLLTLGNSGSKCIGSLNQAFTGNTVTWLQLKPFVGAGQRYAAPTASINVNGVQKDPVEGAIIIPPGCAFGLFVLAQGTTMTVAASLAWEEIPA